MTARLLVVDDVPANLRLLEARLSAAYYEVKSITDPRDVQAVAEEWQPDVILLDVMMPEMSGYDVCRQLKADPATAHIPVIMVTALNEAPDRRVGLGCGADEFLTKPVEHEILLARLRGIIRLKRLLDEWRARGETALALGLRTDYQHGAPAEPGRALIVDDLASRAARLRQVLDQAGIATVLVRDESAACEATQSAKFDLIAISLSLTGGDPLRLVGKLRAACATRDTPLLLIANQDQRELLISGLDLGATDCLMLPLDECELLLRASNHIQRKLYQDRLRLDVDHALELAVIDPLTQLYNRRYLTSHLDRRCAEATLRPFAVMMADVDHFKAINDRFGHSAGDRVLRGVADALRAHLRESDLVTRYGGEEFVAVVGGIASERQATGVAEKLRSIIEQMPVVPDLGITISIGVALSDPAASGMSLIERADRALYEAKRAGRNRVMAYSALTESNQVVWDQLGP